MPKPKENKFLKMLREDLQKVQSIIHNGIEWVKIKWHRPKSKEEVEKELKEALKREFDRFISATEWKQKPILKVAKVPFAKLKWLGIQASKGKFVAKVIFPSGHSKYYLVDGTKDVFKVQEGESGRLFLTLPLKLDPKRYLYYEEGAPVATYYWDYPNPIPIIPTKEGVELVPVGLLFNMLEEAIHIGGVNEVKDLVDVLKKNLNTLVTVTLIILAGMVLIGVKVFGIL